MKYFAVFLILVFFASMTYHSSVDASPVLIPYFDDPKTQKYFLNQESYNYVVPYDISDGTLRSMTVDCYNADLSADIIPSDSGQITLHIPRLLIDAKTSDGNDDVFLVTSIDEKTSFKQEILYKENLHVNKNYRSIEIPFEKNFQKITIYGTNWMPTDSCKKIHKPPYSYLLSPLKQFKSGITIDEIECKDGLVFAQKGTNGNPICITPETKTILEKRDWIELPAPYSPYPDHN